MSKRVKDYDLMLWWAEDPENNLIEARRIYAGECMKTLWCRTSSPSWSNTNFEFRKLVKPLVPRHHQKIAEMYYSDNGSVARFKSHDGMTTIRDNPCWCPDIVYQITMSDGTKYTSKGITE